MTTLRVTALALAGLLLATPVLAQNKPTREQEQLRRMRVQMQQLQQERDTAVQEATKLRAEMEKSVDALQARESAASKRAASAGAELTSVKTEREALARRLSEAEAQVAALTARAERGEAQFRARDEEAVQLQASFAREQVAHKQCVANNLALYQYGTELLDLYQGKGVWTALTQREPVTGITQVRIENVLEEYRDKLAAERLRAPAPDAAASAAVTSPGS